MKTLVVSLYPPNKYGGHVGGVVILLHDILNVAPYDVDLLVYKCETQDFDLPANVSFVPWSHIVERKKKRLFKPFKYSLYKDYQDYCVDVSGYNKIVLYPYWCSLFTFKNNNADVFTIGMDSGPLLYMRAMLYNPLKTVFLFAFFCYAQALMIDKHAVSLSKKIFTVGKKDAEYYRSVFLADAVFVHHPVTKLIEQKKHRGWDGVRKLKICFPGGMTSFYAPTLVTEILQLLCDCSKNYCNVLSIRYLGRMPNPMAEKLLFNLEQKGFDIKTETYVDDFEDYIASQDIVLLPLQVGVGTKNKALTTLGMGVDIIGTPIAMENIYGVKNENMAVSAEEFLKQIDRRLVDKKLYGLRKHEMLAFKDYHSEAQWRTHFWENIYARI